MSDKPMSPEELRSLIALKKWLDAGPTDKTYTRAEVLAFGERVREACALAIRPKTGEERVEVLTRIAFSRGVVRAVDVARLLDSGH